VDSTKALSDIILEFMSAIDHFRMLARYNRIANERLYEKCAELGDGEYRAQRRGSFGSIHALLNHILLGDRIWMSRFRGEGQTTPWLATILYDDFADLRLARAHEDSGIETFFANINDNFLQKTLPYTNSKGVHYTDPMLNAVLHMFNHQTHHRGQVHVMLSQTEIQPPSLDMHRILNP
jgi:uncharacterized damage-inducible protein DinB